MFTAQGFISPCFKGIACDQCAFCDKTELKNVEKSICVICAEKDVCQYDRKEDTVACHRFKQGEQNNAGQKS